MKEMWELNNGENREAPRLRANLRMEEGMHEES
jgi:hypothetical protein